MNWDRFLPFYYLYFLGLFGTFSGINFAGQNLSRIIFPLLYLFTFIEFWYIRNNPKLKHALKFSFLLLIGIFISSFFSYNPLGSFQALLFLYFNFLFSILLFIKFSPKTLINILLNTIQLITIIGIIVFFVNPKQVIYFDPLDRESILGTVNYKGLYPHKIHAGFYNVIGVLLSVESYRSTGKKYYLFWSALLVILTLMTGSSLAFTSLILVVVSYFFVRYLRKRIGYVKLIYTIIFLLILISVAAYFDIQGLILDALGRDRTLTGRTVIWDFGIKYIKDNFLIGGGFDVFFDDTKNSPAQRLWANMDYYNAPSFHNGYIELLAETGIVGAFPIFLFLLNNLMKTLKIGNPLYFCILFLILISNFGAALLIKVNSIFFVISVFIFLRLNILKRFSKNISKISKVC